MSYVIVLGSVFSWMGYVIVFDSVFSPDGLCNCERRLV